MKNCLYHTLSSSCLLLLAISIPLSASANHINHRFISHASYYRQHEQLLNIPYVQRHSHHINRTLRKELRHQQLSAGQEEEFNRLFNWYANHHIRYTHLSKHLNYLFVKNLRNYNRRKIRKISKMNTKLASQYQRGVISSINNIRVQNHLRRLKPNYDLQKIANYRIKYCYEAYSNLEESQQAKFVHGMATHTTSNDLAKKYHIKLGNHSGENVGEINPKLKGTLHYSGCPKINYNNGYQEAKEFEATQVDKKDDNHGNNHDGHRKNILNPKYHYIGVSVYANDKKNNGTVVEDFSS